MDKKGVDGFLFIASMVVIGSVLGAIVVISLAYFFGCIL